VNSLKRTLVSLGLGKLVICPTCSQGREVLTRNDVLGYLNLHSAMHRHPSK